MVYVKRMLLTEGRGGNPGITIKPKALVIHWTANTSPGADAVANRNYFEGHPENKVSAHYVVDDHQVVQCIEETKMAYHVGAKQYKPAALKQLSAYPNDCTIGIEMCVHRDGDFAKTYQNAVDLAASILHRYGWWTPRLWRHFDVTGKACPKFWTDDSTAVLYGFASAAGGWQRFKADVEVALARLRFPAEGGDEDVKPTKVIYRGRELDGFIKDGRTFVEVRKLCEAFGKQVVWDEQKVEVRD
jgi:N-acetylmuramoyl-L-alanine amidase CwlA